MYQTQTVIDQPRLARQCYSRNMAATTSQSSPKGVRAAKRSWYMSLKSRKRRCRRLSDRPSTYVRRSTGVQLSIRQCSRFFHEKRIETKINIINHFTNRNVSRCKLRTRFQRLIFEWYGLYIENTRILKRENNKHFVRVGERRLRLDQDNHMYERVQ